MIKRNDGGNINVLFHHQCLLHCLEWHAVTLFRRDMQYFPSFYSVHIVFVFVPLWLQFSWKIKIQSQSELFAELLYSSTERHLLFSPTLLRYFLIEAIAVCTIRIIALIKLLPRVSRKQSNEAPKKLKMKNSRQLFLRFSPRKSSFKIIRVTREREIYNHD